MASPQLQRLEYEYPHSTPDCPEIALPADLGRLSLLTSLTVDVGMARITTAQVNAVVETLPLLLTLSLTCESGALKDGFPVSIASRCCGLEDLKIVGGMSGHVPSELGLLTALTRLMLDSEMITTIPDSISQLTALQRLKLSKCNSVALPEGLSACHFLTRLTICDDVMSPVLAKLHSLRRLSVGSHPQQQYWTQLTALTQLALAVNDEEDRIMPTGLSGLRSLRKLKISNAEIKNLPAGPYLESLESLVLLDCNLPRGVPKRLVSAWQLRELDLRDAWDCCQEVTLADIKDLSHMPALEILRLDRPVVMNAAQWERRVTQLRAKCANQGRYLQWDW